jgi:3-oxoacyl-[acyl-carrier-protein] synthase II
VSPVGIVACGALSGLGEGRDATSAGEVGEAARVVVGRDEELAAAGLSRPYAARVAIEGDDRATTILRRALVLCANELDAVDAAWRTKRVGLVLGTSSGGMRSAVRFFDGHGSTADATYFAPMRAAETVLDVPLSPATLVLGACASSTIAIGLATRWLEAGACDLVLAGGFDAVSVFVAAGFEALRATTASLPSRPFRVGRDGMALGEGAAVLALSRDVGEARAFIGGFAATADAVHLTAPDRSGAGLARAARAALDEAGGIAIDLVSAHATATAFNDAAEARAIHAVLGGDSSAIVHPMKAQIGHTLGAAGALELLACVDAMERGIAPAAAGTGKIDDDARVVLLERAEARSIGAALKLSSAFGGANAALVVTRTRQPTAARPRHEAHVSRAVHVAELPELDVLARTLGVAIDRLGRTDLLTRLALAAVAKLAEIEGSLAGAGIVVGTALATLETNAIFHARIRDKGARGAEPRRFPYTSPNAAPGECALHFSLTGPGFAVGSGLHAGVEALAVAAALVEAGDAERMVVVAVDEAGEHTRKIAPDVVSGAVATLVTRNGGIARISATTLVHAAPSPTHTLPVGHRALVPLAAATPPRVLEAASPPDAYARIDLA